MQKHHLKVERTARYFTLNESWPVTERLWFVLHGYGQSAESFIHNFSSLDASNLIVAPEGLSRFYWDGFQGKVVASWMTSDEREKEIEDYVLYLEKVFDRMNEDFDQPPVFLGFSQGAHTLARWLEKTRPKNGHLIFWGAGLPHDLNWIRFKAAVQDLKIIFAVGREDIYITEQKTDEMKTILQKAGIQYELIFYEGGHKVERKALQQVASAMVSN